MFTFSLPMELAESLYKILLADSALSKRLCDSDIILMYLSDSLYGVDDSSEV